VNLTEWARRQGIHPQTAYRWFREGTLPVPAVRVNQRTVLVAPHAATSGPAAALGLYARVSSHDQRSDLDRQLARLAEWAAKAGQPVVRVEAEVGSGMNGARSKLRRLLADPEVTVLVVEHRDWLARMNAELVEATSRRTGAAWWCSTAARSPTI
jgi:putative resolvase